jgi:hypothetical protein
MRKLSLTPGPFCKKVISYIWSEVQKSYHLHLVRSMKKLSFTPSPIYKKVISYTWSVLQKNYQLYLVRSIKKLSVTLGPIWKKVISLTWSRVIYRSKYQAFFDIFHISVNIPFNIDLYMLTYSDNICFHISVIIRPYIYRSI